MSLELAIKKKLQGFRLDTAFRLESGCLGILGASGCGKSMTLKCVAGIERPDEGRILVNGRALYDSRAKVDLPPQRRKVGYLFQNYALFPHMTVWENVACGLPGKRGGQREKIGALLRRFHLESYGERYPGQLSGGQQQRAALARMLVGGPEVVLLDEPFSALDAFLREQMQFQLLELLADCQNDFILVTHSRDEVYKLCDRLMVMDNGRPIAMGGTKELFRDPGLLPVARLTGCKNISRARRVGERRVEALDWGVALEAGAPVADGVSHVGIRAHDFHPATADGGAPNLIPIRVHGQSEGPFEWSILFTARDAGARTEKIWWKISKPALRGLPDFLTVSPGDVLLLRESRDGGGGETDE